MSDQPLKHGHQHLALGPDPIPSLITQRAVLYDGAGDTTDGVAVPIRYAQAYIMNDPAGDVFQLNVTNVDDPDGIDRYQLQLMRPTGWYRIECVVGIDDSSFLAAFEAYLRVDIGDNSTLLDHQYFPAGAQPFGPWLRVAGDYDGGAIWPFDGGVGSHKIDPVFQHSLAGTTLGWDTAYLKVHYLGDAGDVNAAPWNFSFLS